LGSNQLFIDFEKAYDSVKKEVLYNIIEFGIPMKVIRFIKLCLNETYSKVRRGKNFSDEFLVQNGLKGETMPSGRSKKIGKGCN
jgi:hypothetical protein